MPANKLNIVLLAICISMSAQAEVKVPPLFADHMVLQRGMESPIWGTASPGEEIHNATNAKMRLFHFPQTVSMEPSKQVKGQWKTCTPESAPTFSAVAYFFGREISKMENVPVGLIANPWGGMPAEAFTSREALM